MLRGAYQALRSTWFVRRPRTFGAHALALTPAGKVVLVKLRYASGWRFPGGGRNPGEDAREAALRELREEIGMTAHGQVQSVCDLEEITDFKRDCVSLLIVRDVEYRPRWSWEVEAIREAELDRLPSDLSPRVAGWLHVIRPALEAEEAARPA